MEKLYGRGIAAVLATNTKFHAWTRCATAFDSDLNQFAYSVDIDGNKRIACQQLLLTVNLNK